MLEAWNVLHKYIWPWPWLWLSPSGPHGTQRTTWPLRITCKYTPPHVPDSTLAHCTCRQHPVWRATDDALRFKSHNCTALETHATVWALWSGFGNKQDRFTGAGVTKSLSFITAVGDNAVVCIAAHLWTPVRLVLTKPQTTCTVSFFLMIPFFPWNRAAPEGPPPILAASIKLHG